MTTGRPVSRSVVASVPPEASYRSTCSRTQSMVLGSYSPCSAIPTSCPRRLRSERGVLARHPFLVDRRGRRRAVAERTTTDLLAPVWREPPVEIRPVRHDAGRVDVAVHDVVVPLDVVEVDRVPEARRLEQIPRIRPQHRQLRQLVPVALEVAVIDGVEACQRR